MINPPIYLYTNIAAPYSHHLWEMVCDRFPGSAIILTSPLPADRPWTADTMGHSYPCHYFPRNMPILGKGMVSTSLVPWLCAHSPSAIHLMADCGAANRYLIRYLAKSLGGLLVQCNDGAFADHLTDRGIQNYRRHFLPAVPAVFAPGEISRTYFGRLGYADQQIFNAYFSHDVDYFTTERIQNGDQHRQTIRRRLQIPDDGFVILSVSRLLELKRLEDLHEALAGSELETHHDLHVVQIGDGSHVAPINAMQASSYGCRFHWIKAVPYEEMPQYYAAADVLVFPSEGDIWGLVVNEALSMGKPVICTDRIGAAELVRDGENGFIVPVRSPQVIADRLVQLFHNPKLRLRMSQSALDIVNIWNSKLALESLEDLVRYVLQKR